MPPEKLFRFRTLKLTDTKEVHEQSLREITVPEIYLASPESLNDPFEFSVRSDLEILGNLDDTIERLNNHLKLRVSPTGTKEQIASQLIEELLRQTSREFWNGVACFQDTNDCLLTWAHYGSGHSGICIEYDPSSKEFEAIKQVNYDDAAPMRASSSSHGATRFRVPGRWIWQKNSFGAT